MDVECILRRTGGTEVEMEGTKYHFLPNTEYKGAHVAAVENKTHLSRFLGIPEAYRLADDKAEPPAPPAEPVTRNEGFDPLDLPDAPDAPEASDEPVMGDDTMPAPAPEPEQDDDAPVILTEPKTDEDGKTADGALTAELIDAMSREELDAEIERREGRKPRGNAKDDTLRDTLKTLIAAD